MVPREVRTQCSTERTEKRRESLGVQSLANLANLPLTGRGPFVLDGAKRFYVNKSFVGSCRRTQKGDYSSRAASE